MSEWRTIYYCGQEIRGRVAAHKCHCCGHHELVVEAGGNDYLPLRPGMKVIVEADPDYGVERKLQVVRTDEPN